MLRDSKFRFDRLSPMARPATIAAVLLCGLLLAGRQQAFAQAAPTILGNWQAESVSIVLDDGNRKTFTRQEGIVSAVISEKTFTLRLDANILNEMDYVLDTKQTPWTIDMTSKEGVMLGICTLNGDDLKISLNDQAKGRPTDFDKESSGMALVLRRYRYIQLSVINADGSGLHQVAAMPDFTRLGSPDWSHDESKIAFNGWQAMSGKDLNETRIFVVNADGGGLKDLGLGCMPSWSPDDKQLTYCQYYGEPGVWIMNADGSDRRLIDSEGWGSRWSPQRNEIAYAKNLNICIYNLAKSESRTLLTRSYRHIWHGVGWSPDGKWISFLADLPDGGRELAAVSIDGEEKGFKVLIPSSTPGIMTLQSTNSCGGAGNQVLVSMKTETDRTQRLYVIDFAGDKASQLFPGVPADYWSIALSWSRDGKRVAFCLRQPAKPRQNEPVKLQDALPAK